MFISWWKDNENLVQICKGILYSWEEILNYESLGKCIKPKITILSQITKTQKDKCHWASLLCRCCLESLRRHSVTCRNCRSQISGKRTLREWVERTIEKKILECKCSEGKEEEKEVVDVTGEVKGRKKQREVQGRMKCKNICKIHREINCLLQNTIYILIYVIYIIF